MLSRYRPADWSTSRTVRLIGALLAAGSAVLHGLSMIGGADLLTAVVTTVMGGVCLVCGYMLMAHGSVREWMLAAMMNIVMIGMHLPMTDGHHHGDPHLAVVSSSTTSLMAVATGVAAVEVLLAAAVLIHRTRDYSERIIDDSALSSNRSR